MGLNEFLISFFAGMLGGLCVYYMPSFLNSLFPIFSYQLNENTTNGLTFHHTIKHSYGKPCEDLEASNNKAWEHTDEKLDPGHTTFYGPYTKQLPFRGRYKTKFRTKTLGIKKDCPDQDMLVFDVCYGQPNDKGVRLGIPIAETVIRLSHLKDGKYKYFPLNFHYDGESFVEFRCAVKDPSNYKAKVDRILFDKFEVYHYFELWDFLDKLKSFLNKIL